MGQSMDLPRGRMVNLAFRGLASFPEKTGVDIKSLLPARFRIRGQMPPIVDGQEGAGMSFTGRLSSILTDSARF